KQQLRKYEEELPEMKLKAEALTVAGEKKQEEALKKQDESKVRMDDSHHAHAQANLLDFAHLGAEIGIVLCSLALLTKRKVFWFAGLLAALVAIVLAITASALPHHPPESHEPPSAAPAEKGKTH